ncbi:ATP-binding protein [Natronomonas salina]|uniref:ATP-binding protein n=1 Tax=Natronomonas salina TaxID=1710540 RepID=UPI0015B7349A|nr:ATP-binding protein [Natronomonas salina]QLD87669.1 ATP-binding protein [Natronomonas salina]
MMRDAPGRKYWGLILITIGVAFAAAGLTFWFAWGFPETSAANQVVLGIVVHVLFGYIVVMSGITIYRSDLAYEEALIAAKWCLGGLLLMTGLVVWSEVPTLEDGPTLTFLYQLVVVGSVGAAAGVLIGLNRGQAVQNARLVTEHGDQQETLVFLLQLLRHDTQNDLTTISGYVDLLEDHVESETGKEHLARIERRTESMRDLFRTAGTILESETGRRSTEVVDLTRVLRDQIDHVGAIEGVTVETDLEADLEVAVDPLVDELFRNVFDNAIAHNPIEGLTISVSSRAEGDEAVVEVADDGEGIPADIREDVFDPDVRRPDSEGDGLGLYLVRKLVDSYGGTISVSETDPSGTRFTVRLPRV